MNGLIDFVREMFLGRWIFYCKHCGKELKIEYLDEYEECSGRKKFFYYCPDHKDCGIVGKWD